MNSGVVCATPEQTGCRISTGAVELDGKVVGVTANSMTVQFENFRSPPAPVFKTAIAITEGNTGAALLIPHVSRKPGQAISWSAVSPVVELAAKLVLTSDGTIAFTFSVEDGDHVDATFTMKAVSSDEAVLPTSAISITPISNANGVGMFQITAPFSAEGEATVTLTATDDLKLRGSNSFVGVYRGGGALARCGAGAGQIADPAAGTKCAVSPPDPFWEATGSTCGVLMDGVIRWGPGSDNHLMENGATYSYRFAGLQTVERIKLYQINDPKLHRGFIELLAYDDRINSETFGEWTVIKQFGGKGNLVLTGGVLDHTLETSVFTSGIAIRTVGGGGAPEKKLPVRALELQVFGC